MAKAPVVKVSTSPRPPLSAGMEAQFENCKKLAASVDRADEGSRKALRTALAELYAFGETLRTSPDDLEAFIRGEGRKWNKPTRDNPYTALTHIIFPKRAKSRLSTYAKALGAAHKLGHDAKILSAYIGPKGPGVEKLAGFAAQTEKDQRARALRDALPSTKARLATWPDLRDDPAFKGIDGFAEVLVHVDAMGAFKIIDVVAKDQAMNSRLLQYARPMSGPFHALSEAMQFIRLVPSKNSAPRIVSLHSKDGRIELRAQGHGGVLTVAHFSAIDGLPDGQWMHFTDGKADLVAFVADADDDATLSATDMIDANGRPVVELALTAGSSVTKIVTDAHEAIAPSVRTLKPEDDLGIAFALNLTSSMRRDVLHLGETLLSAGRRIGLGDGRQLSEKRNARITFDADGDSLSLDLVTVGGKAISYSIPFNVVDGVAFEPLTLPAAPFFQALKLFDQFAGNTNIFIRGGSTLVELAADVDGVDVSLVIPNSLELQRDTTPFTRLFVEAENSRHLEAAE